MFIFKKFSVNQLIVYTFSLFWITFILMVSILLILPYIDTRIYTNLQDEEVAIYQKKLVSMIRHNQLNRILADTPILPFDKFDGYRPIIIDNKNNIMGALADEKEYIYRFADVSNDPSLPQKKTFRDTQIAGPFIVHLDLSEDDYLLYFIEKVNSQKEILKFIFDKPWNLLIVLIILTTPLLWWFSRMIIKPIGNLQKSANIMALGDFQVDKSLATTGPLELRLVGKSFNRMAQAISNLVSNQQNLLSSISHELRTPLTRLQLVTALMRKRFSNDALIERVEKEINQMDKMINDLLILSRQQMNSHIEREVFDIKRLWEDIIPDILFEAEQRKVKLEFQILITDMKGLVVNGNLGLLHSAVENVIRNALKYTKDKIIIKILLGEEGEGEEVLIIRVEDNGLGLPESEFEKIFKPFYRVDEARTRSTGGTGLGLAIVHSVVHEHQGRVWAEKSSLGGLAINIRLPLWINL